MTDIRPPQDWQQAFAALPLETPPPAAAARFASQLHARRRPPRWRLPAIAAAVCLLAAAPALLLVDAPRQADTPPATASGTAPTRHAVAVETPASVEHVPTPSADTSDAPLPAPDARRTTAPTTAAATMPPSSAPPTATASELQQLHGESARLEALLSALSSGESGDAVQLALAASLQAQVAGIDDALAWGELDAAARTGLWRERVDVLRQLTGLAADQRLAVLHGGGADYAVLPVY
jgi:hypothetical protein